VAYLHNLPKIMAKRSFTDRQNNTLNANTQKRANILYQIMQENNNKTLQNKQ
jgi:hypothetical protein